MLDSYLRYRSYFCIKDYGSWTCYGKFLRAVELWITCSSTKGEKHAFLVISTTLYNIDTIIFKKHLMIYLTRSKVKVHEHTCTSTSISELIKHLSVRIKIKHIYIRASKCIITLQIILCKTMLTVNSSIYYVPSMYLVFFFSVKFLLIAIIYIQYITILQTVLNRRKICELILTASKSICHVSHVISFSVKSSTITIFSIHWNTIYFIIITNYSIYDKYLIININEINIIEICCSESLIHIIRTELELFIICRYLYFLKILGSTCTCIFLGKLQYNTIPNNHSYTLNNHAILADIYYMYIMIPVCMLSTLINPLLDPLLAKYQCIHSTISTFDVRQRYKGLIVMEQLTHCHTEAIVFYVGSRTDIEGLTILSIYHRMKQTNPTICTYTNVHVSLQHNIIFHVEMTKCTIQKAGLYVLSLVTASCILTTHILLSIKCSLGQYNFDCRNNDKTENTYTNLLLLRHLCQGVKGRQRWLDIVICTCISNALYYSIRIALFSYLAHQLNMILDESSFNSMSNTMVSEHIDYPTYSYYMKNQHYNATYNAMLDIHLYHPMLNCRPPQNDCFGSYLYSDFIYVLTDRLFGSYKITPQIMDILNKILNNKYSLITATWFMQSRNNIFHCHLFLILNASIPNNTVKR